MTQRIIMPHSHTETRQYKTTLVLNNRRVERKLVELLRQLGIPVHVKGYHYLREAVEHMLEIPCTQSTPLGQLYSLIAQNNNASVTSVERGIRNAIELAWNRGSLSDSAQLFGRRINLCYEKPTNGEMIALLAEEIRIEVLM